MFEWRTFHELADAKKKIEKWRKYYNEERPHSSIGMKISNAFEKEFMNLQTREDLGSVWLNLQGNRKAP